MNPALQLPHPFTRQAPGWIVWGFLLFAAASWPLHSQLAITEVMSSAATNQNSSLVPQHADFWELTNFGAHPVDLSDGYRWNDEGGIDGADATVFSGLSIGPGESIIFFQLTANVCLNADDFRAWWGPQQLPANLQLIPYSGNGFAAGGYDAVQLWHVTGASTNLVQRVELYAARQGFTFCYDPATGEFDQYSTVGDGHAFKAEQADDVGSPGWTTGPVPITFVQQPQALKVDAGNPATFRVRALGLPRPRFQWTKDGAVIAGATASLYTIPVASTNDAGSYAVELANGLETRLSNAAVLEVNTTPLPASIVVPPADLEVTTNQTAVFTVEARGYPPPQFQWQWNGVNMLGETNATLVIRYADYAFAGTYCVRVQNPLATTNACANLTVARKPRLVITEMMGAPSTNTVLPGHDDWWELTNLDTNAVKLNGYRFDDLPGDLNAAMRITNALVLAPGTLYPTNEVIIQPGESMLFLSNMAPEAFACWWGESNLPERVQFVCYTGNGFDAQGDSLTLWNASATDREDYIARAEYTNLNDDGTPRYGVSLTFWCDGWIWDGQPSVLGECGGIRAAESDDIGSPGFVSNHPSHTVAPRNPRCLQVARDADGVHLTWSTQCQHNYELQCQDDVAAKEWTALGQYRTVGARTVTTDTTSANRPHRFYRLSVLPGPP